MAKYVWVKQLGMFTYALDECEDYITLDAYLRIKESRNFEKAKHLKTFEFYHLQEGGMLNDNILVQLNGSLRQLGCPSLVFINGHTTNFASLRGQEKVTRRMAILDHIRSLDPINRVELIQAKRNEASCLPERSANLPNRPPEDGGGNLNRAEVERRRTALFKAQTAGARRDMSLGNDSAHAPATETSHLDGEFVPESTVQDNVVELIAEMQDLKTEVASLKQILQTIFRNV